MKQLSTESPLKSGRYLKSEKFFFDSSKLLAAQITQLLDFVWPTAAAMWSLRWQVKGFLDARDPTVTVEELHAKFGSDTKIVAPNYYRACIGTSWEEQTEQFAGFLLINAFAYFESWITETLKSLGIHEPKLRSLSKRLQFPDSISVTTIQLATPESKMLRQAFFESYSSNKKFFAAELVDLLKCFRFFKESRNCIVHSGGIADSKLEKASLAYENLVASDLAVKEIPAFHPIRIGDRVNLNLRGVVGFLDIILKIVNTLDARLLCSSFAEQEFERKWRLFYWNTVEVKKSGQYRKVRIGSLVRKIGFKRPTNITLLEEWLLEKQLIF